MALFPFPLQRPRFLLQLLLDLKHRKLRPRSFTPLVRFTGTLNYKRVSKSFFTAFFKVIHLHARLAFGYWCYFQYGSAENHKCIYMIAYVTMRNSVLWQWWLITQRKASDWHDRILLIKNCLLTQRPLQRQRLRWAGDKGKARRRVKTTSLRLLAANVDIRKYRKRKKKANQKRTSRMVWICGLAVALGLRPVQRKSYFSKHGVKYSCTASVYTNYMQPRIA